MTLAPGSSIGKYVVVRKLAEGGMAEIYLCTAKGVEGFEKDVVIKRVRSHLAGDRDFVEMFIAEARLASQLNHANVVQIFDFDKHEDTYYLAMEYVRGASLQELRKRARAERYVLSPTLIAHLGAAVARGLQYAHQATLRGRPLNLVHRDVTPHNVLLSSDGAIKLADFGIAKASNKLTVPGVLKGKFAYMSPEQARGDAVDARTDVFALGIILWELLTGGRLFEGDTDTAILRAVQHSLIVPPGRINSNVPADLDAAVMRALDRDLRTRFATARDLERALAECALRHAKRVEDTDVGALVRRLIPEWSAPEAESQVRTALSDPSFTGYSLLSELSAPARKATARMPGVLPRAQALSETLPPTPPLGAARPETQIMPARGVAEPSVVWPALKGAGAGSPGPAEPASSPGRSTQRSRFRPLRVTLLASVGLLGLGGGGWLLKDPLKLAPLNAPQVRSPPPAPAQVLLPPAPAQPEAPSPAEEKSRDALEEAELVEAAVAAKPVPPHRPVREAPETGVLVVRASPYATVLIDGRVFKEVQGQASLRLPTGRHRLTFQHPLITKEEEVSIERQRPMLREFKVPRLR